MINEELVNNVMIAIVVAILVAVGLFIMVNLSYTTEPSMPSESIEVFSVTNSSSTQFLYLKYIPSSQPHVDKYNDTSGNWETVTSTYVTWYQGTDLVTVASGGLRI